jgi:voltage-gated potassium channel
MAVLILPILAAELFWTEQVASHAPVRLALDLGTVVIWLAFCVEFIVMSTLAPKKLAYLARNWINLAIIVMPFLAFLRGLRIGRLLWLAKGLGKAVKTFKVYRVRGLWMRGWRGMVALDLLERLIHRTPERRLRRLREVLAERERDISRLRGRIQDLETEVRAAATQAEDPN